MITLNGGKNFAHIMIDNPDESTISQLYKMLDHPAFKGTQIRIMADCHAGKGSVVGFTSTMNDYVIPNVIGVDIYCGIESVYLGIDHIDFEKLDNFIRNNIPSGTSIRSKHARQIDGKFLYDIEDVIEKTGQKRQYVINSLGTLGGGNHFIEVDKDPDGGLWLTIHTGSRNFGYNICAYHQNKAKDLMKKMFIGDAYKDLEFLPLSEGGSEYLEDMVIASNFALLNRRIILEDIINFIFGEETDLTDLRHIKTAHNYIDFNDMMIRKGAVSAHGGEDILIPFNMRDGIAVCKGKGSAKWNYSAPHGAGRVMSRRQAKAELSMENYAETMRQNGVYTSSVSMATLDEAPEAYKNPETILEAIKETADIQFLMHPVYNFKGI